MLTEIKEARQVPGEGYRRWFTDPDFDFIIWYPSRESSHVTGFQLCYDKRVRERCITWRENRSFQHHSVDDGETPFSQKQTPVLMGDGEFRAASILQRFLAVSDRVDPELVELVRRALGSYPG